MLSQLYIENIAVIRQATIDFQQGFHVFTGETGAGKTILISAINAVLGGRTFKEIIRTGETRATVSALFTEISEELCKKIEVLGYPLEDNQLLVQREIDLSGKGQCRLDGRPATAAMLREVCSLLIDIHGQHDNQELLSAEKHLGFLDSFGEYPQELAAYTAAYDKMCDCAARLDKLQMDESYKLQRMDILQFQIKEIGDAKLSDGEEERLVEQQKRIRNAERITESLGAVYTLLNGNGEEMRGVLEALEEVSTELDTAAKYLTEFGGYSEKLSDAYYMLEELGSRARDLYTVAREPMPLVGAAEYTRRHDPNWLVQAWFNLMGRSTRKKKPTQEKFEPLVTAPFVSVASRVSHMLRGLLKGSLQKMGQLFSHEESRSTNVATFLALLELIRAGRVKVDDSGALQLDRTHRRRKDKTP